MVKAKRKIRIIVALIFFASLGFLYYRNHVGQKEQVLQYFYYNACASCQGDKEFMEFYKTVISKERRKRIKVETRNIFQSENKDYYERELKKNKIFSEPKAPCLLYQGSCLQGEDAIKEHLKELLVGEKKFANKEEKEEDSVYKKEEEKRRQALAGDIKSSQRISALLFTTSACQACEKMKKQVQELNEEGQVRLIEVNIAEADHVDILYSFFEHYKLPSKEQKVPLLFMGEGYAGDERELVRLWKEKARLSREDEILAQNEHLSRALSGKALYESRHHLQSKISLIFAGLLAGLNPCALSMFFLLLSLAMTEKEKVFLSGSLYLAGKYVAYLSLGMGIYRGVSYVRGSVFQSFLDISFRFVGILCLFLSLLYIRDAYILLVKGEGRIKTQLPRQLRQFNQALIKKSYGSLRKNYRLFLLFVLGIAVSLGEFFCTGQIYMASIVYLLQLRQGEVWIYFLIYVSAMSLPSFVFLLFLQKTRNMDKIAMLMARKLGILKVVSGLLFLCYALYFLLK